VRGWRFGSIMVGGRNSTRPPRMVISNPVGVLGGGGPGITGSSLHRGLAAVDPVPRVVGFTKPGWSITAGERAPAVAGHQRPANAYRHGAHDTSDVQRFGVAAEHHRDQFAVAGDAPGGGSADPLPVIQSGCAEPGAQRLPIDGHGDVWRFACGGGELFAGAGPLAQLNERIGVALGHGAGVRHAVALGVAGGELLDQHADQAAVFGIQPAFQPETPVAPLAQPQLAAGRRCGRGFIVRGDPSGSRQASRRWAMMRNRRGSKARRAGCATDAGSAPRVSVITRNCPGPMSPTANAAAVAGSHGDNVSPVSARRPPTMLACSTRARASPADRCSIPPTNRAVVPKPARPAVPRESMSAIRSSITAWVRRDSASMSRSAWLISLSSRLLSVSRRLSKQSDIACTG